MASAKDGKEEVMNRTRNIIINVLSGAPIFEVKPRGDAAYAAVDLTAISTYPLVEVKVSSGHYRFTLNGGTASFGPSN